MDKIQRVNKKRNNKRDNAKDKSPSESEVYHTRVSSVPKQSLTHMPEMPRLCLRLPSSPAAQRSASCSAFSALEMLQMQQSTPADLETNATNGANNGSSEDKRCLTCIFRCCILYLATARTPCLYRGNRI